MSRGFAPCISMCLEADVIVDGPRVSRSQEVPLCTSMIPGVRASPNLKTGRPSGLRGSNPLPSASTLLGQTVQTRMLTFLTRYPKKPIPPPSLTI
jgi:hypothetical protein